MISFDDVISAMGGAGVTGATIMAWFKLKGSKRKGFIKRVFGLEPGLAELREAVAALSEAIDVMQRTSELKDALIEELHNRVAAIETQLELEKTGSAEKDCKILELEAEVERLKLQIIDLQTQLDNKTTKRKAAKDV